MTVLNHEEAFFAALKFAPEGSKMTIYTKNRGRARTGIVAQLSKELGGGWNDWQIIHRPATADDSLLPADWPNEDLEVISSRTLADILMANPDLWADIAG